MKVEQFKTKNQFIMRDFKGNVFFQSYNTVIAHYNFKTEKLIVSEAWNYSVTTTKYFYMFLEEYTGVKLPKNKKKCIQDKIKDKSIKLVKTIN